MEVVTHVILAFRECVVKTESVHFMSQQVEILRIIITTEINSRTPTNSSGSTVYRKVTTNVRVTRVKTMTTNITLGITGWRVR